MEEKKWYEIRIDGESGGVCHRHLTYDEYDLINGIFEETNSEYVEGRIVEAPLQYVVRVQLKIDSLVVKRPADHVCFLGAKCVSDFDKNYTYYSSEACKQYFYFFDTEEEATKFANDKAAELGCKITNF